MSPLIVGPFVHIFTPIQISFLIVLYDNKDVFMSIPNNIFGVFFV